MREVAGSTPGLDFYQAALIHMDRIQIKDNNSSAPSVPRLRNHSLMPFILSDQLNESPSRSSWAHDQVLYLMRFLIIL
jgi:hypothetical protein